MREIGKTLEQGSVRSATTTDYSKSKKLLSYCYVSILYGHKNGVTSNKIETLVLRYKGSSIQAKCTN